MTTKLPKKIKKEYNLKKAEFIWLSDPDDPKALKGEALDGLKKFMKNNPECVILIDEVEYLILENGYDFIENPEKSVLNCCEDEEKVEKREANVSKLAPFEVIK